MRSQLFSLLKHDEDEGKTNGIFKTKKQKTHGNTCYIMEQQEHNKTVR